MSSVCTNKVCTYCEEKIKHPLFLYLLIDDRVNLHSNIITRDQIYVGLSSQPLEHVKCHNRETGYKAGVKITKANAGHWKLHLCLQVNKQGKKHKMAWRKSKDTNKLKVVLRYLYKVAEKDSSILYCPNSDMIKHFLGLKITTIDVKEEQLESECESESGDEYEDDDDDEFEDDLDSYMIC